MTDATELMVPLRGGWAIPVRRDGRALELVLLGAVVVLLVAASRVGGANGARPDVVTGADPPAVAAASARPATLAPGLTPDVTGMPRDAGAAALVAAGYTTVLWVVDPTLAGQPGAIVRQDPAAGVPVRSQRAAQVVVRK